MFYDDKFHREAFARDGERGDVHVLRESYAKVNSNTVRKYFDFIFDVTDYRLPYGNCSISFSPRSDKIT